MSRPSTFDINKYFIFSFLSPSVNPSNIDTFELDEGKGAHNALLSSSTLNEKISMAI